MIVEYIYISNGNFKQSLNFSNKFSYKFSSNTIKKSNNNSFIKDLFGDNITNINALIGENGAGKTTVLRTILGILNNDLNKEYNYLVVFREEDDFYFASNIQSKINCTFKALRKSINFIANKLNIIFYSNVFDGNNIYRSNKITQNISTNALVEDQLANSSFSLNTYQKEQNEHNILFTILNRKVLELDDYIKIPAEIHLQINEANIITDLDTIINKFRDLDIKISLLEDKEYEILDIISYNYYLKLVKWMEDLTYILNTNADNNLGRIIWNEYEFEKAWINLNINQEAETDDEINELKDNIKSILLKHISEFSGDKEILSIGIKQDILSLKEIYNLTNYSLEYIVTEMNYLIIDQFENKSSLTDEEFDKIKTTMLNLDLNINAIKSNFKEWINSKGPIYKFIDFIDEMESEYLELLRLNSKTKIYDGFLEIEDDVFIDYDEMYIDLIEHEFREIDNYEKEIKESFKIFEIDYLNDLINILKSKVHEIKDHLYKIEQLIGEANYQKGLLNNNISVSSKSHILYEYFKKYHEEKVFAVSWRNLSSGEYSFLGFLSRFYKVNREVYKHSHLLIFIDEGELYFHPQWQKKYIFILIKALNHIFSERKIQIVITSHSPLIISDLPHYSIELIDKSKIINLNDALGIGKTFAANIQDLYANAFFLKGGLTGEFSKYKINEAIKNIMLKPDMAYEKQDYYIKLFNLIGEPIVKEKSIQLLRRYITPYENKFRREKEIKILRERIKLLESEL
ncbi:ATP-binding protein [Bacillus subtilis]|uniref:AAA family ATPase n=1 Tax=Bacillus subtilis TaxID=1423 RepID=UPI0025573DD1|nr:AAA family ATPase [Bacillus subtilis]MDL2030475.1 ATP-binding protein [Bacillus subtilis]